MKRQGAILSMVVGMLMPPLLFLFVGSATTLSGKEWEYEFLTPRGVVLKGTPEKFAGKEESEAVAALRVDGSEGPEVSDGTLSIPKIETRGYWRKENALKRDRTGTILRTPEITSYFYLFFDRDVRASESVELRLADDTLLALRYDPEHPTPIIKLNQLGNGGSQERKYAYVGEWCGTAGALSLNHLEGKEFELIRAEDRMTVFRGTVRMRRGDPRYQGKIPFTGEEVAELDYSEWNTPGRYFIRIPGIGRSMEFTIGPESINEAFYIHARGLYHKRCGIAKELPFTAWESPACHRTVIRGRFPGNADHYRRGKESDRGFFDRRGNRIEVKPFELIKANPPYQRETISAPGGWHDAADYDRRPYHLRIVSDLATVYLLKPENFMDGQLNIPESGNGIPDILDEAAWGLKHLLALQQPEGGVGTWVETTGHPQPGEGLPDADPYTYYSSAPSRNGTLEYAAAASTLALALKRAGAVEHSAQWLASAERAWEFAADPKRRLVAAYQYNESIVFYREEPELAAENLLQAGLNLYVLTGNEDYLKTLVAEKPRLIESFKRDFWRWSPLSWMNLHLFAQPELSELLWEYRKVLQHNAEQMLEQQNNAYPYRVPWYAADAGWVHSMAWGNFHPLRRAMTLIAAHALTGERKFLTGAFLANDFHNGANPSGMSMTSGLGQIYPAVFLDLVSYADDVSEFVPGITPYGNTFGLDRNAVKTVYGDLAEQLPIWHRRVNLEFLSVPSSEYSVWETIAPAAVVTGYLIEKPSLPTDELRNRKPADEFRELPGYRALP